MQRKITWPQISGDDQPSDGFHVKVRVGIKDSSLVVDRHLAPTSFIDDFTQKS